MTQLEPHCADCGTPVSTGSLCAACEQDRSMQLAEVDETPTARAIRGEI